ncbi:protein kinase [Kovacikia minuta CCNUW1]|uniref:serine/threonine-protein kinase n=1 Tax=Kovacikia minuta TaxID=2931930 RepID=UPI001CCB946B|nr:serine/threonine-protein kinase [Kovacikia minuta]UBF28189.1 protein kinase [Kovacikia minuta CCNUW1]
MLQIFSRHRQTGRGNADDSRRKRLIGKTLDRRYRIIDLLGEGGFSHTYIAEDTRRPKNPEYPRCVVKHLRKSSSNPDFLSNARRLFRIEAETLERLGEHNQIPRLLAYFEEWGEFYLVQEYIQGHPLSVEWKPGRCWSDSQVYAFLCEMLEILSFVHQQGVIHRDVKPDNIIRRHQDNKLCLVDFGTVKQAVSASLDSSQHTITTGTPGYIPIEQWRGNPQFNSDIYALGVVAVQLLTGVDPESFQGNPERILRQHRPQTQVNLAAVIDNMVRTDWHDRYASAQEVLQSLYPLAAEFSGETLAPPTVPADHQLPEPELSSPASATIVSGVPTPPPGKTGTTMPPATADETVLGTFELEPFAASAPEADSHLSATDEAVIQEPDLESSLRSSLPTSLPARSIEASLTGTTQAVAAPVEPSHPIATSRWQLFAGVGVAGVGAIAVGFFFLVLPWRNFQAAEQTLKQADQARQAGNYSDCLTQAGSISEKHADLKVKAQVLVEGCSALMQANQLASGNNFQAAIAALDEIAPTNPAYGDAQKLIQQWGDQLLQKATEKYQKGDFTSAIALLKDLPASLTAKVQPTLEQWQKTWEANQDQLQAAQSAMEAGNWKDALEQVGKIDTSNSPYWEKLVSQLKQEAQTNLEAAKEAAKTAASPVKPASSQSESSPSWLSNSPVYNTPRQPVAPPPVEPPPQRPQTATGSKICPSRVPGC